MPETLINLQPFCGAPMQSRYNISGPYIMAGYLVATDARIAVRIPCDEPDTPVVARPFPNQHKLFDSFGHDFNDARTEPFPAHSGAHNPTLRCQDCRQTGRELVECMCMSEEYCRRCNDTGEYPGPNVCKYCEGDGHDFEPMEIKGRHIRGWLVRLINTLPNPRVFTHGKVGANPDHTYPLPFIFDNGGQGLVMPSNPRD